MAAPAQAADRASELVSPPDKNGGQVRTMLPSSADGESVLFLKSTSNPDSVGAQVNVPTLARRTPTGWTRTDATLPVRSFYRGQTAVAAISEDTNRWVLSANVQLDPDEPRRIGDYDLYDTVVGQPFARLLNKEQGVDPPPFSGNAAFFRGGSASLDTVIFELPGYARALPEASDTTIGLYRKRGNDLELVSVMPDGSPPQSGDVRSAYRGQSRGGGQRTHEVSVDGQRVFFRVNDALYLRDGNARTLAVSASQRDGEGSAMRPATLIGATPSGDSAYFWSAEPLTDGASGGGVYRYDVTGTAAGQLTRVTGDPGPDGLNVTSALTSDDGETVYFVTTADLAPGATGGQPNAYVWRGGQLRFVATLADGGTISRVSADGAFALLRTTASLGTANTGGYQGLYVYNAEDAGLACASCRADGSPNEADATVDLGGATGQAQGTDPARGITSDGRAYFTSADRLVDADSGTADDVYVFENGAPTLLTAGNADPSYLLDNTEDGDTVFVSTAERRVPEDTDFDYDLYALRVGGGFPSPEAPQPCVGEACRGSVAPEPTPAQPKSTAAAPITNGPRDTPSANNRRFIVKRSKSTSQSVSLTVTTPAAGTLRTSGRGTRAARVVAPASKTYRVRVSLTAASKRALARTGRVNLRLKVRFVPKSGKTMTKTIAVTLKSGKGSKKGGR